MARIALFTLVVFTVFYGCGQADAPTELKDRKESPGELQKEKTARNNSQSVDTFEEPAAPGTTAIHEPTISGLAAAQEGGIAGAAAMLEETEGRKL